VAILDAREDANEATSEAGFIDAGTPVEVVGRSGFALVVRGETPATPDVPM
jgi:membrane-bound ClpP family serine protease